MRTVVDNWQRIFAAMDDLEAHVSQVGWFDPDAARIATINDRGGNRGDNPPPRPVLAPGMDAARNDVLRLQARAFRDALHSRRVGRQHAEEVGATVEQAVRDAIEAVQPPNAPSTLSRKHGYAAPLRGFSPDRIWNKLEHHVASRTEADNDAAADV